ncbi:hypothetical protein ACRN9Z_15775 [Shewanella frigidimarina]|uniref:hypothetical protein n=1 Tax=Shewanella frigidimarina TaxID=56812 RepID=UPI003D790FEE
MMKRLFFGLCKLFGKEDRLIWAESAAMMVTLFLAVVLHAIFLLFIFEYDMTFLVEEYGTPLLMVSLIAFSCLYFLLSSKFKAYAKD